MPQCSAVTWKGASFVYLCTRRYVVDLEPRFDASGASVAAATDRALFSALRTPQVLTLHLDTPEAWLVEITEAAYKGDASWYEGWSAFGIAK